MEYLKISLLENKLKKLKSAFPLAFINNFNELILYKNYSAYFRLDNIQSELDFDCKVLAYCSREASKGLEKASKKYFRTGLERYFNICFSQKELELIYTYLGNDIRRSLCKKFISEKFNYDLLLALNH